ncbi:MAG: GNAT family N-acetyltransferase [Candidatus Omnitrophota bacterium]
MKEIISIDGGFELHPPEESDVPAIVKALQNREIYERTIMIPFPYSEKDGREFVEICSQRFFQYSHPMDWGIYKLGTGLIGMIGFTDATSVIADTKGVGYWLAKAYWGQGIMPQVLRKVTDMGFKQYGFKRLEMPIFSFNNASCRVAEKCGYRFEKDLPAAYQKGGKTIDAKLYVINKVD